MFSKEHFDNQEEMLDVVHRLENDGFREQIDRVDWKNGDIYYHNEMKSTIVWLNIGGASDREVLGL